MSMVQKLDYTLARRRCPRDFITCESTLDLDPLVEIIGQERAVKALQFGLDIKEEGFNIYVAGMAGTGKKTAIMTFLEQRAKGMPPPPDWCYVYNFEEEDKPNALRLPTGMGVQFRDDVAKYVEDLKKALAAAFESEDYATRREEVTKRYDEKKQELMKTLNKKASDAGFVLQRTEIGLLIIPVINGQMINEQQIGILPQSVRDEIQARRKRLQDELRSAFRQFRDIDRETETNVESFNREVAEYAMEHLMQRLRDKYGQVTECNDYLDALRKDVLENLGAILGAQKQQESQLPFFMGQAPDPTLRYRVNLVVDNSKQEGAPVIMEMNPTHSHLFGATEKEARFGPLVTAYTMIRAGSAQKANRGYLGIHGEELARNPGSYEALDRKSTRLNSRPRDTS